MKAYSNSSSAKNWHDITAICNNVYKKAQLPLIRKSRGDAWEKLQAQKPNAESGSAERGFAQNADQLTFTGLAAWRNYGLFGNAETAGIMVHS